VRGLPGRRTRLTAWALVGLLLLGLALRVQRLDFQPLWWDEGYSIWFATHPIGDMIALTAQDIHPPLYYALLHAWIALLGPTPIPLRLFSVFVSLPGIALAYVAARRLLAHARPTTIAPALVAALLVTFNPFHLYYSQEIRMYGLVGTLALAYLISVAPWLQSTAAWTTVPRSSRGIGRVSIVALTTIALAYTQYYALLLPLGATLLVLARRFMRHRAANRGAMPSLAPFIAAHMAAAMLYAPWVIYAAPKLATYVAYKVTKDADTPLTLLDYTARHLSAFLIGHAAPTQLNALSLGALVILAGLIVQHRWLVRAAAMPSAEHSTSSPSLLNLALACLLAFALAVGFIINLRFPFTPVRGERLLASVAPVLWLSVAAMIAPAGRDFPRRAGLVQAALALGLIMVTGVALWRFFTVPRYTNDDYRPLVAEMSARGTADDAVFCVYPWQVGYLRSYLPNGPQPLLSPSETWTKQIVHSLHEIIQQGRRVWFPAHLSLGGILETQIEASLMQQGFPVLNQWINPSTRLTFFAPPPDSWRAAPGARFGAWLTLDDAQVAASPVAAGNDAAPVRLTWRLTAPSPTGAWQVRLRLTDSQGETWAQRDSAPANGQRPFDQWSVNQAGEDRHALWIPAGTPPGRYDLRIQVYLQSGDAAERLLDVQDSQGQARGAEWRVGQIEVVRPNPPLNPTRLAMEQARAQRLGSELRWLGYDLAVRPWMPGDDLRVSLGWQVLQTPTRDWRAFVQLLDAGGQVAAGWEGPPLIDLPGRQWRPGDLLRTPWSLRLPAALPDASYRLIAGFFDPTSGQRLAPAGQRADFLFIAPVQIKGRPHQFEAPAPTTSQVAQFGSQVRLLGHDLSPSSVRSGDAVTLTLYWQAAELWTRRASVFVHLLAPDGQTVAQADDEPGAGRLPTTSWLTGEYLADSHVLRLPAALPPGVYPIEIGFYFSDGARLPMIGADGQVVGDRLVLTTPLVVN
jgi:hypothetical protein